MGKRFEFKIIGMDCAEEVAVLRHALTKYISDEKDLGFDLLNGKLSIEVNNASPKEEELIRVVQKTGMQAVPWQMYITESQKHTVTNSIDSNTLWCHSHAACSGTHLSRHIIL